MSVLIRLKPPCASDLTRKRKVAANHDSMSSRKIRYRTIIESSLMLQFNGHILVWNISGIIGKNRRNNGR